MPNPRACDYQKGPCPLQGLDWVIGGPTVLSLFSNFTVPIEVFRTRSDLRENRINNVRCLFSTKKLKNKRASRGNSRPLLKNSLYSDQHSRGLCVLSLKRAKLRSSLRYQSINLSAAAAGEEKGKGNSMGSLGQRSVLMICGDYMEDYEVMVPFQALRALGISIDCVSPGKISGDTCFTAVHDYMGHQVMIATLSLSLSLSLSSFPWILTLVFFFFFSLETF